MSYLEIITKEQYRLYYETVMKTVMPEAAAVHIKMNTALSESDVFVAFKELQTMKNKKFTQVTFTLHQTITEAVKEFMANIKTRETPDSALDYAMVAGYCIHEFHAAEKRRQSKLKP